MSLIQKFIPSQAIAKGKSFYSPSGKQLDVTETKLGEYIKGFQGLLSSQGILFAPEEFQAIQTAAALIDALAKTRFDASGADFSEGNISSIESGHHAFNVFYKAPDSDTWKLQFANAAYLEKIGANLPDKLGTSADELMQDLYTPETIESFTTAAKASQGGYTAQFIEMDKVTSNEHDEKPAFFWYRKEFNHPDGGKIQVRIGMNGTGLSQDQKDELSDAYKLADILRRENLDEVYYSKYPHALLIDRIKEQLSFILESNTDEEKKFIVPLGWMQMVLEIADDIVKNSPFPLTIVDGAGVIEQISPAYSAMIGYTVKDILNPGFFDKIYPGVEGKMVRESIAFYVKNGYYPESASFLVSRGNTFSHIAEHNGFRPLKTLELIPFPYPFASGTVRLNTARPLESIPGMDDDTVSSLRFVTDDGTNDSVGTDSDLAAWFKANS